ncbi:MAG TPA: hypothetical protein H9829_04230 [Candidatus Tetragenococcus pullicola]|nr:hypothetical protein [Candidatus Tetragenococcus pullicola]
MTNKQKTGLRIGLIIVASLLLLFIGKELLTTLGIIGMTSTAQNYTRSAIPHGTFLVLVLPIIATSTLFFGVIHAKK